MEFSYILPTTHPCTPLLRLCIALYLKSHESCYVFDLPTMAEVDLLTMWETFHVEHLKDCFAQNLATYGDYCKWKVLRRRVRSPRLDLYETEVLLLIDICWNMHTPIGPELVGPFWIFDHVDPMASCLTLPDGVNSHPIVHVPNFGRLWTEEVWVTTALIRNLDHLKEMNCTKKTVKPESNRTSLESNWILDWTEPDQYPTKIEWRPKPKWVFNQTKARTLDRWKRDCKIGF